MCVWKNVTAITKIYGAIQMYQVAVLIGRILPVFFQVFKANVEAVKGGALWLENMPLAKKKQAIQLANGLKCDPCCPQSGQQGSKKKTAVFSAVSCHLL